MSKVIWDENTMKSVEEGAPEEALEYLETGFKLRMKIFALKEKIDSMKKEADAQIEAGLTLLKQEKASADGIGTGQIITKTRSSYNVKEIQEYLLGHGVSSVTTKNAIESGKKISYSSYVDFRRAKIK
jgi:uncharacterized protein YlxW (UPF0749 family)